MLAELPRRLPGFDAVEILVVDDGSEDATSEVARAAGAATVRLPIHRGLARAFTLGIETALRRGADVIVNTDADGQYDPAAIPAWWPRSSPARPTSCSATVAWPRWHTSPPPSAGCSGWAPGLCGCSPASRWLTPPPGLRAFSRAAAARLNCYTTFTYTLETLIQAGQAGLAVRSVPVTTRPSPRPSRLFRSNLGYVAISLATLVRLVFIYRPLRSLLTLAAGFWLVAAVLAARFGYYYFTGISPAGHVQSLIAAAVLALTGVQLAVLGVLADLTAVNRRLLDELRALERERK